MTKKKTEGLMMTAHVGEYQTDGECPQSFVLYFDEAVEALDVSDMVTITIVKSEAQDG